MYCYKCGNKVNENSKYCGKCGTKLKNIIENKGIDGKETDEFEGNLEIKENEEKTEMVNETNEYTDESETKTSVASEYLYFSNIPYRTFIPRLLYYIEKGFMFIISILILSFIQDQMNAGENLKFIIYIIRFFTEFAIWLFWSEVINLAKELLDLKYIDVKRNTKKEIITAICITEIICYASASYYFMNPSDSTVLKLTGAILNDSFIESLIDVLFVFKVPVLFIIVAGVLEYIKYKFYIVRKEND